MADNEQLVREKAYELWLAAGKPEGSQLEHWEQAKAASEKDSGAGKDMPAAGPHAKPELTNPNATPGSGMFPEPGDDDDTNAQPSG